MTVTALKNAGSVMQGIAVNVSAKGSVDAAGFGRIWEGQSGKDAGEPAKASAAKQGEAPRPGESLKAREARVLRQDKVSVSWKEAAPKGEALDEAQMEEAVEVMGTAAAVLMERIADVLGISPEEVENLLSEMNLEPVDLLDQAVFGAFALKAVGAQDVSSLLTQGELYQDFKQLLGEWEAVISEDSGIGDMNLGELKAWIAGNQETLPADAPEGMESAEPIIEVTVDTQTGAQETAGGAVNADTQVNAPADKAAADVPKAVEGNVAAAAQTAAGQPTDTDAEKDTDVSLGAAAAREDLKSLKEQEITLPKQGESQGRQERSHSDGRRETAHRVNSHVAVNLQQTGSQNPALQNIQASQTSSAWSADTQNIMRQIMDYLKIQVKPDTSSLEMQLHPASLGTLQIHVASKGGVLTAGFVVQNEAVKAALESQMVQLKESFAQQGVKVEAIEVTVQTHQFEENLEQGRRGGSSQNPSGRRQRNRRITPDDAPAMDALGGMEDQEQLSAQMLAAAGSTVNYTA